MLMEQVIEREHEGEGVSLGNLLSVFEGVHCKQDGVYRALIVLVVLQLHHIHKLGQLLVVGFLIILLVL
jgi:hypothetical protein